MRVFTAVSAVALLVATGLCDPAAAQASDRTTLRDRINERVEQRREAAKAVSDADAGAGAALGAGTHTLHLAFQGLERKVLVHVPAGYKAAAPTPLVIALHGGGGHAEVMANEERYGLVGKAECEGFVVVFPNGYSQLRSARFATWNAGRCCGDARDHNVDDVGYIRALVNHLKARVNVDASRVFATGMSNGGMVSHRLACEAADVFRAVASVAGTDATVSCSPARRVSPFSSASRRKAATRGRAPRPCAVARRARRRRSMRTMSSGTSSRPVRRAEAPSRRCANATKRGLTGSGWTLASYSPPHGI